MSTIQLARTFKRVSEAEISGNPTQTLSFTQETERESNWSSILKQKCVVVLGEAGTGKTTEFRQQVELLNREGKWAFYLPIENLATGGLKASLMPEESERLKSWLASDSEAFLFLDSLDEARLHGQKLPTALRKFASELGPALERTRIILSCRGSDWRIISDVADLQRFTSEARSEPTEGKPERAERDPAFLVSLEALTIKQVRSLALNLGVEDIDAFLRDVTASRAEIFVERPRDVEWLVLYWNTNGKIGALSDLISHNIQEKLKERNPDRQSILSSEEAYDGASAMAGVMTLSKCGSVSLPDAPLQPGCDVPALDPHDVLANWNDAKIKDLLTRPLFDEGTYGRAQIHHRSVQEYLTAEWLLTLIGKNSAIGRQVVRNLLFRTDHRGKVIAPEFRPAAAWLSLKDDGIRREIIGIDPRLLIEEGDPNGFSTAVRSEILRALAHRSEGRNRLYMSYDEVALGRFAAQELGEAINNLLGGEADSEGLCEFLLDLIAAGRISASGKAAFSFAIDDAAAIGVRTSAIGALGAVGTDQQIRETIEIILAKEDIDQDLVGALVSAFYPKGLPLVDLLSLLKQASPPPPNTQTSLSYLCRREITLLTPNHERKVLANGLLRILKEGSSAEGIPARGRWWLLDSLPGLLSCIFSDLPSGACPPAVVDDIIQLFDTIQRRDHFEVSDLYNFKRAVGENEALRRHLLWRQVARKQSESKRHLTHLHEISDGYELWKLSPADVPWLARDAQTRKSLDDRLIALDAVLSLSRCIPEAEGLRNLLAEIGDSEQALKRRLTRWFHKRSQKDPSDLSDDLRRRAENLRTERSISRDRDWLATNLDAIRKGENLEVLGNLWKICPRESNRWTIDSIGFLQERFGKEVALAAKEGWMRFWREFTPPFPHHKVDPDSTPIAVIVGLNGIAAEVEEGLQFQGLTAEEATKATLYALHELNGFPPWLYSLSEAHPTIVSAIFRESLSPEFHLPANGSPSAAVLRKFPRAGAPVLAAATPTIFELLDHGEPPSFEVLRNALHVLLLSPTTDLRRLAILSAKYCDTHSESPNRFAPWWTTWLQLQPEEALDFLEAKLKAMPSNSDEFVQVVASRLYFSLEAGLPFLAAFKTHTRILQRLIRLVYSHVRPEEDIEHQGAYSPGSRDNAQMLRIRLVNVLAEIDGDEAETALIALADDSALHDYRDVFLNLAEKKRSDNASLNPPAILDEIRELYRRHGLSSTDKLHETAFSSSAGPSQTSTAAVVFTDLVGSVDMQRRLGTSTYAKLLARHDELFNDAILGHTGRILQGTGDGFLSAFDAASHAVAAALQFQLLLETEGWHDERPEVRIGIHLGELGELPNPEFGGTKPVGMAINLAARVMDLAGGNQILMTRNVYDDARQYIREYPTGHAGGSSPKLEWRTHGKYRFKGCEEAHEIFEVGGKGIAPLERPSDSEKAKRLPSAILGRLRVFVHSLWKSPFKSAGHVF